MKNVKKKKNIIVGMKADLAKRHCSECDKLSKRRFGEKLCNNYFI